MTRLKVSALVATLALGACGGSSRSTAPRSAERADRGIVLAGSPAVLAYRHDVSFEAREGAQEWAADRSGVLFLEPEGRSGVRVVYEDEGDEVRPLPVDDEAAAYLYFPRPDAPVGPDPFTREWTVPTMAPAPLVPFVLDERISATPQEGGNVLVRFERRGVLAEGTNEAMRVTQEGEGLFDPRASRYERMTVHTRSELLEAPTRNVASTARFVLDEGATEARAALITRIRDAERQGSEEYEAYVREHGPAEELAAISARLFDLTDPEAEATLLEVFHSRASPAELWRRLVSLPEGPARAHLMAILAYAPMRAGEELPEEVVPIVSEHVAEDDEIARLVIALEDERFRPEIERLARSRDEEIRRAARDTLAHLDSDQPPLLDEVRESVERPEALITLADRYVTGTDDPRPLVPLLLFLLQQPDLEPMFAAVAKQLLERITLRTFDTLDEWARFYDEHEDQPYDAWLLEASQQTDRVGRLAAAVALEERTGRGRERLRVLAADPDPVTRFVAAEALVRVGDPSAVPVVVSMLRDSSERMRLIALMALAYVAPQTFGFDPAAPADDRARAIGRIERWAAGA